MTMNRKIDVWWKVFNGNDKITVDLYKPPGNNRRKLIERLTKEEQERVRRIKRLHAKYLICKLWEIWRLTENLPVNDNK